jgi:hypothetical protein
MHPASHLVLQFVEHASVLHPPEQVPVPQATPQVEEQEVWSHEAPPQAFEQVEVHPPPQVESQATVEHPFVPHELVQFVEQLDQQASEQAARQAEEQADPQLE